MRKPTLEEEVLAWRHLAWHIDMHRTITMNEKKVIEALNRITDWVAAHSDANGERPEAEVDKNVSAAFWSKIAQQEPKALESKRGRPRKKSEQT